jgi:hypothetical protein
MCERGGGARWWRLVHALLLDLRTGAESHRESQTATRVGVEEKRREEGEAGQRLEGFHSHLDHVAWADGHGSI